MIDAETRARAARLGERLLSEAEDMTGILIDWRRSFHQFPEVGMEEYVTASKIEDALHALPDVEIFKGFGMPTCVVARVGGDRPGPATAIRTEMDAVEVREDTGLPFSSFDEGVFHAQGHDAHMAATLGAVSLLARRANELAHPVVFIFQPGEEGKGGAKLLIEAGVQQEFDIERVLCLHWMPALPYGKIFTNKGGVTAYSSKVHIGLTGPGGHGSTPHLTSDPLYLSAQIQIALQSLITREVAPNETAVLSFGRIEAGDVYNVIAEETHLWGTLRAKSEKTIDFLRSRIEEITKSYARAAHVAASVEYMLNYDQVRNDGAAVTDIFQYGTAVFGSETVVPLRGPLLAGEDFSFFANAMPSCLMFLGTGMEYGLYHARYDIPEDLLPFAAAWCAFIASAV